MSPRTVTARERVIRAIMEVGTATAAAKPIRLAVPKSHVVYHITPPDDEPVASKPVPVPKPKNVYSLSPSSRSPSPSRRSSPRTSFLQDAYRALTGARRNSGTLMPAAAPPPPPSSSSLSAAAAADSRVRLRGPSCLLDVPKDGQFRNRSKSLDDGTRKPPALTTVSGSVRLDSGDAYKIFDNILKEGTSNVHTCYYTARTTGYAATKSGVVPCTCEARGAVFRGNLFGGSSFVTRLHYHDGCPPPNSPFVWFHYIYI